MQTIRSFIGYENSKMKDKFASDIAHATEHISNEIAVINQKIESILNISFNIKAEMVRRRAEDMTSSFKNIFRG